MTRSLLRPSSKLTLAMKAPWHLREFRSLASGKELDAILISRPSNIFYATGFKGGSRLLVPADGEPVILVGGVDLVAAQEHFSGTPVKVEHIKLGEKLDDLMLKLLKETGIKKLGFDELPLKTYSRLVKELGRGNLTDLNGPIWDLRKSKDKLERELVRKACQMAVKGMEIASELMEPSRTELEIVGEIEEALRKAGSEEHPFNIIVASGPNSALPHARASGRELKKGELVIVDLGATCGGYVSDITRTFVVGKPEGWQEEIYHIVREAQEKAIMALRAGLKASEVDKVARSVIEEAGYGPYFIHGLGHGLGIEVHEPPRLAPGFEEALGVNYTVTVEPGIYLPGKGGVRVEDTVLVLEDGREVLTEFPYGLELP